MDGQALRLERRQSFLNIDVSRIMTRVFAWKPLEFRFWFLHYYAHNTMSFKARVADFRGLQIPNEK